MDLVVFFVFIRYSLQNENEARTGLGKINSKKKLQNLILQRLKGFWKRNLPKERGFILRSL